MSITSYGQESGQTLESMSRQNMLDAQNINSSNAPRDLYGYRSSPQLPRSADMRTSQRKPTPSPLQISAMTADSQTNQRSTNSRSPTILRTDSATHSSSGSSASPHSNFATDQDQPRSPVDRLDELLATETVVTNEATGLSGEGDAPQEKPVAPPKAQSYGQLRNVSSPLPHPRSSGNSPPLSPTSTISSRFTNSTIRPSTRSMPRTSSIDSAISTISSATSHSHKSSQDSFITNPADISHLINTAGSPEAVIQHLLKEKQHSTTQNAQLWKLLDKQRALILGLNQDLERALRDKERYRKKLKDHLAQTPPAPGGSQLASQSPTPSDSNDERPWKGNRSQDSNPHDFQDAGGTTMGPPASQKPNWNVPVGSVPPLSEKASTTTIKQASSADPKSVAKQSLGNDITSKTSDSPRIKAPLTTRLDTSNQDPQAGSPVVSPSSFTAKRLQPLRQKSIPGTPPELVASSPPGGNQETFLPPRKLPPAPLDLRVPGREVVQTPQYGPDDHSGSEYEDNVDEAENIATVERGRKKTRAEDDKEREALALKELEHRSRSKKEKGSKTPSVTKNEEIRLLPIQSPAAPMPSAIKSLFPEPSLSGGSTFLSAPTSLASVLTPTNAQPGADINRNVLSMQPLSPGLPMSPRPGDRPMNSPLPRMPRDGAGKSIVSPPLSPPAGFVGLPLSPRAPKQFIPLPPNTPMSIASPRPIFAQSSQEPAEVSQSPDASLGQPAGPPSPEIQSETQNLKITSLDPPSPKGIYRGFVSESFPDLLIPPNALPSIIIKVTSSLMKPSRNSYLVAKGLEEEPVFVLGVSARSDHQDLWQVEKSLTSLPHLDHQLKQSSNFGAKLPDRSLFNGQAPAKIDSRKIALEKYFETILDTPMDDKTALVLCHYLSTQVIDPSSYDVNGAYPAAGSPVTLGSEGKYTKEGYLTKRGKNFGGWKARFFILDDPVLRYYESPTGTLLGTIKLYNAKIGKPSSTHHSNSPSRGAEESDNQYRHAFLILEPKRKDSNSHVRHVLCAESDAERDAWVEALLCYVDGYQRDENSKKPSLSSNESSSSKGVMPTKRPSLKGYGSVSNSPQSENFDALQTLSYDNTVAAQPPLVHITPDQRQLDSPSPQELGSQSFVGASRSQASKTISGPSNGARIQDVGAWGNRPLMAPQIKDKEHKKRSIWGFRDKNPAEFPTNHSNESSLSLTQQQYYEQIANVRPVFGMQLSEAAEHCSPRGVDVCLPAVVYRCLEYLEAKDAASEEGIFRLSGSSVVIKDLRNRFNIEGDFDFLVDEQYHDVHAVASLLKLYLRELPTSILTRDLHLSFIQVLCKQNDEINCNYG